MVVGLYAGGVESSVDGSVVGGDGLMEGKSNGSGGRMGHFFCFSTVNVDDVGSIELGGGVVGSLMVRCCFGDKGVNQEVPGFI